MSEEHKFDKVYHTQDGKTVYVNAETNQAQIFDGTLSVEAVQAPQGEATVAGQGVANQEQIFEALKHILPAAGAPGIFKLDFIMVGTPETGEVSMTDVLGPKEYYVLGDKKAFPLGMEICPIHAWVSEHQQGHHPDYKGYKKHRIMPEQWDWLAGHKNCRIVAWRDEKCPVYVAVACQDHARMCRPVTAGGVQLPVTSDQSFALQELEVAPSMEHVLTEERDV